jgi:putative lipoprotein
VITAALAVLLAAAPAPRPRCGCAPPAVVVSARVTFGRGAASDATSGEPRDAWFGPDKVKHFFMSAFIQSVAYSALRAARVEHGASLAGAAVATAGLGVGKELHDWRARGEFSARDLVWDAAGASAAAAVLGHTVR